MITRDQYNEWRHHPATLFFLKYVADFRKETELQMLERWIGGGTLSDAVRGQINLMKDIEELRFEAIERFYQEDARKADQDNLR